MAGNILSRYVWLVDTINHAGKITLAEINQKWKRTDWSGGNELPRRTFHNYRIKIEELFDINFACDGFHRYFIEMGLDDDLRTWLLKILHHCYRKCCSVATKNAALEITENAAFLITVH